MACIAHGVKRNYVCGKNIFVERVIVLGAGKHHYFTALESEVNNQKAHSLHKLETLRLPSLDYARTGQKDPTCITTRPFDTPSILSYNHTFLP